VSEPAAIRTRYDGTWFRSRLEARWAAFFDGIGWRWEYEPFDWDGYIPDFLILGANPLVVEVKPEWTAVGLEQALARAQRACPPAGKRPLDVIAVGAMPCLFTDNAYGYEPAGLMLQWCEHEPWVAEASWHRCAKEGCDRIGVFHSEGSFIGYPCGHYDGDHYLSPLYVSDLEPFWARARNATQWRA